MNQAEIENKNRPITSNDIESVIKNKQRKNFQQTKGPGPSRTRWLHIWILSNTLRRGNIYPSQTIPKICKGRDTSQVISKASITMIPNQTLPKKENSRPVSVMNIEAKILNKIITNQIQNLKDHYQVGFIPWIQRWFNLHISSMWHITLTNWRKKIKWSFPQRQKKFLTKFKSTKFKYDLKKNAPESRHRENIPQHNKSHL